MNPDQWANPYREFSDSFGWDQAKTIRDYYDDPNATDEHNLLMQIVKLQEEIGEVAQAFIGWTGQNKRKGITHTRDDVGRELVDVIITGMVALVGLENFRLLGSNRTHYVWTRFLRSRESVSMQLPGLFEVSPVESGAQNSDQDGS